eukprot:scaffold7678_cov88-Isochrysis_galbana.AAC.1
MKIRASHVHRLRGVTSVHTRSASAPPLPPPGAHPFVRSDSPPPRPPTLAHTAPPARPRSPSSLYPPTLTGCALDCRCLSGRGERPGASLPRPFQCPGQARLHFSRQPHLRRALPRPPWLLLRVQPADALCWLRAVAQRDGACR